jgi:hypothetical protein
MARAGSPAAMLLRARGGGLCQWHGDGVCGDDRCPKAEAQQDGDERASSRKRVRRWIGEREVEGREGRGCTGDVTCQPAEGRGGERRTAGPTQARGGQYSLHLGALEIEAPAPPSTILIAWVEASPL